MISVVRSAFLSFYRSLTRHPLYAGLNLLGLSFGIAVFIVLSLFVRFETSYERWLPNAGSIYTIANQTRTGQTIGRPFMYSSPGYALDAIRQVYPDIRGTRMAAAYVTVRSGNVLADETGQLVDPDFFAIFDLPVVAGDRQKALVAPNGVILSERMARKYFGRTDVVGELLSIRDTPEGVPESSVEQPWRVLAVLKDIPPNSNLKADLMRALPAYRARVGSHERWYHWGAGQEGQTFLILPPHVTAAALAKATRSAIVDFPVEMSPERIKTMKAWLQIEFRPFTGQHLFDPRRQAMVYGLGVTAWLTLAVALTNYINLATARADRRAREVAARGVHGATRLGLIGQFLVEAVLAAVVSLVLAISLVETSLPVLNEMGGLLLKLDYAQDAATLAALSGMVLASSLLAGLVPAALMAGVRSVQVLTASRSPGAGRFGRRLREGLTIVQFVVVGVFFIVIGGFAAQLRHMQTADLGFSRNNLLLTDAMILSGSHDRRFAAVRAKWRETPGIEAVTSGQIPGVYFMSPQHFASLAAPGAPQIVIGVDWINRDFFQVYRTRMVTGRAVADGDDAAAQGFHLGETIPDKTMTINIDINMTAVRALGFATPEAAVGQTLLCGAAVLHIVGVVEDQHFQQPTRPMLPVVYGFNSVEAFDWDTIVRYSDVDRATAERRLRAVWAAVVPERPLLFRSIREEMDVYYRDDRRNTKLFAVGGAVAGLIGAIGLFGMAAFSTSARVHEIGIRKSVGASRWRILRLLMFQFLRPVLIANLIAWPVAYLVLDAWLKQFDDRVAMSLWFFVAGSGLSLLIAAVTVVGVAVSASSLSPARALRQL